MRILLKLFLLVFVFSCQSESELESPQQLLGSLPHETPGQIVEFNAVDSLFLQHIGYETIALDDGSFILPDREAALLIYVDDSGNLIRPLGRKGRGPGEFQDITSLSKTPDGGLLVYDQRNNKTVVFDSDLEYRTEFIPESFEEASLVGLFAAPDEGVYFAELASTRWLRDKEAERELIFARYNHQQRSYSNVQFWPTRLYARLIISDQVMGGAAVPYLPIHLVHYSAAAQQLYTFWTESDKIAIRNADFDTLRTVNIDLPSEELSSEAIDSLREEFSNNQWDTLADMLPDRKTPVENMHIDHQGRFWLRLNYRTDTQLWLVTDEEGEPQKIVHLPRGGMLTHISEHHLGVRLGAASFALYEPVE